MSKAKQQEVVRLVVNQLQDSNIHEGVEIQQPMFDPAQIISQTLHLGLVNNTLQASLLMSSKGTLKYVIPLACIFKPRLCPIHGCHKVRAHGHMLLRSQWSSGG